MKRLISIFLGLIFMLGLSLNLSAQDDEELDQVELSKQFIGTWEWKIGGDSVQHFICTPAGEGILFKVVYKSGDKAYAEGGGSIGFSPDRRTIVATVVWPGGGVSHDIGRFVTEKKLVTERFDAGSPTHAVALTEWDFSSPNSMPVLLYFRGQNITWGPLNPIKATYTKIE